MLVAAGTLLLAAAAAGLVLAPAPTPRAREGRTILVTVPAGTAARVARGERTRSIPGRIVAHVGDTLRLVNNDNRTHMVGPFLVAPGDVLTTTLARAGTYDGTCTLRPGHRFQIAVRP